MKIAVTGSSSSIGLVLVKKLQINGHEVILLGGRNSKLWKIGESFPSSIDADILIHLAHDRKLSFEQNLESAKILCEGFSGKKIFLSSLSAHSRAISKYGRSKFGVEKVFAESGGVSLRAGIVYGENIGGIYLTLMKLVKHLPFIVIPYDGTSILFMSNVYDLVDEIILTFDTNSTSTVFAANPMPISLRKIIEVLRDRFKMNKIIITVPRQHFDFILRSICRIFGNIGMLDSLLSLSSEIFPEELSRLNQPSVNFRVFSI